MKGVDANGLPQKSANSTQGKESSSLSIARKCPERVLIKELNDNDVLQGRGSGSMQNTGNIRFRLLVEELRPAYVATSSRKEKAKMISDMVQLIQSRKGRFLQRLCDKEVEKLGLDSNNGEDHTEQEHYVEMTDDEAAEKAKQAIRYVHYKKVPLEEERRKKRAADNNFFAHSSRTNNDKPNTDITQFGGNSLVSSTPLSMSMTNQLAQSQLQRSSIRAIPPQLQQTDLNQLLSTLQTSQTAIAAQMPGSIHNMIQSPVHQSSTHRDPTQQASLLQQVSGGGVPIGGNNQHQSNTLQQLVSSLSQNSNSALSQKVNHANQQQLPHQQAQLNLLLQSLLQQQTGSQSNSILHSILQQQQQQQQLNSALQSLQQQHQLTSTLQALQQPQQLSSDQQLQQHLQQQKTNSILASFLSNTNSISPAGSALGSLATQSPQNMNTKATATSQPTLEGSNVLLTSMLSNNMPQISAFQQCSPSNPNGVNGIAATTGHQQQQNKVLIGGSSLQPTPGLAKNATTLVATNSNSNTQGLNIATATDGNRAKRPRLSSDNQS